MCFQLWILCWIHVKETRSMLTEFRLFDSISEKNEKKTDKNSIDLIFSRFFTSDSQRIELNRILDFLYYRFGYSNEQKKKKRTPSVPSLWIEMLNAKTTTTTKMMKNKKTHAISREMHYLHRHNRNAREEEQYYQRHLCCSELPQR